MPRRVTSAVLAARLATPDDVPAVSEMLARAFDGYAWTRWTVAADAHRTRLRDIYRLFAEAVGVPTGTLWVTGDRAAAAFWTPPGAEELSSGALQDVLPRVAALQGERADASAAAHDALAARLPHGRHFYLELLGTDPARRGEGLASAVLAPVLARCDADGVEAWTDTAAGENLAFYARHGFAVAGELDIPGGGPHVWILRRPPQPRGTREIS